MQQNSIKSHIAPNNPEWMAAVEAASKHIESTTSL